MRIEFDEDAWLIQVEEEVTSETVVSQEESYYPTTPCVFRIPITLLKENEAAYVPEIVSLGPYHFGKPELSEMEKHKAEAVLRIQRTTQNFLSVVDKMKSMEHRIRAFYDGKIEFSSDVLCWMMARDASFLLEFVINYIRPLQTQNSQASRPGFQDFHPVFNTERDSIVAITILKDVMKMENQIPLFVLEDVYALKTNCNTSVAQELDEVIKLLLANIYLPFGYFFSRWTRRSHLLEMYHYSCFGKHFWAEDQNTAWPKPSADGSRLPSAVKLKTAGVRFRADAGKMEDVTFYNETSVLSLRFFIMNVGSEVFIRNLIALEMCSPRYKVKMFSEYMQFMDDLIQNERDIAVMKEDDILGGNLQNYEPLASLRSSSKLLPSLSQYTIVQTRESLHRFYGRNRRISCKIMWNEFWMTIRKIIWNDFSKALKMMWNEFRKAYGYKPWLVLGGVGAAIILILTLIQVLCLFYTCKPSHARIF